MKLTPTRGYCLIKLLDATETTSGGLEIPDEIKKRQAKGQVLGIGRPPYKPDATEDTLEVEVGDEVWFKQFAGEPIKDKGVDLFLVPYSAVIGVYK